jgi:sialate O-acetylesterase
MELPMAQTDRAKEDIAAADNPQLRLFTVSRTRADQPADECKGRWSLCTPPAVTSFSATAYFFGADVQRALGVPVGLVHTSWGGTPAEAWTPRPVLESRPTLKQLAQGGAQLYNGMIAPLTRMAVAGAIWYQGEANVGRAIQYRTLFPTMIGAWREAWHREALPFYFVQIAPYRYHIENGRACAQLWEAQLETMKTLPHTGMAVINDSKSVGDIHPRNKRIAGERLARWALAKTYGKTDVVYSGPIFKSAQPEVQVDADKIRIAFDSIGAGLASRDGKPLTYFTIAGADQNFVPATAVIEGDNVLVHSDRITKPVAVRFAWHEDAEPNLINKEGLPASPFRTDDWNLTSEAKRSIAEPPKSP